MVDFEIHYLADKPEFIEDCATWVYGRWGVQDPKDSFSLTVERFKKRAKKGSLPLTVVAVNNKTNLPIAMGSLLEKDGDLWEDKSPWVAYVFTLYRYRGQGIAKEIIERLEYEAKYLGIKNVYLISGFAADYYPKLGYTAVDSIETEASSAGKLTLLQKTLN